MYEAKIVADSVSEMGCRLTTMEVTYPLIVHAEMMTHRVFSRNVASNRAIPVHKLVNSVQSNPFIPERFPKNRSGMQNDEWLEGDEADLARDEWLVARDCAVEQAQRLMGLDVHKQITNRLLAPFLWTTAVITATDWQNFFALRCHEMAQPEIYKIATLMKSAYNESTPREMLDGDWHLPFITEEDKLWVLDKYVDTAQETLVMICIGRSARVSYLTHGKTNTPEKDIQLGQRLIADRHMSPTEHVATPSHNTDYIGNFKGWKQFRKFIEGESGEGSV